MSESTKAIELNRRGLGAGAAAALVILVSGTWASPLEWEQDTELSIVLSSFSTELDPELPARITNIAMAAELLDGRRIEPGTVFSFDDALGSRRRGDGYLPAPVILDGRMELAPAGGICQLSSTLYNAAVLAGLSVVERHPHNRQPRYVAPGRDATVARFYKDLKLSNPLAEPVLIRACVMGDRVLVAIYGQGTSVSTYTIETRTLERSPLEVITYRVRHEGGLPVDRELLSRDVYR